MTVQSRGGTPGPVDAVIFDVDGTLVQTRIASWDIFRPISEKFGLGITTSEQFFALFHDNVYASIRELSRDEQQSEQVRQAFLAGLRDNYDPSLIPGMADVVRRLAGRCTLAVISSNAMEVLRRLLTDNGLAFCFAHVFGGDVAPNKRAAIRQFLDDAGSGFGRRCQADYDEAGSSALPERGRTVLVTDTAGDIRDGLAEGIRAVGVAWGMHTVDELSAAGAEFIAYWPQEIPAYLLGSGATELPAGACALPPATGALRPPGATECGCAGVDCDVAALATAAGKLRAQRRRAAVGSLRTAVPPPTAAPMAGELADAVRRICRATTAPTGRVAPPR